MCWLASTWALGAARLSSPTLMVRFSRPRLGHVPTRCRCPGRVGLKSTRSRFGGGTWCRYARSWSLSSPATLSPRFASAVSARHFCCVMRTIGRFGRPSSTASICAPTAEIEELTERYGAAEILARGGTPPTTQAVGPKARVRRNEPDAWSRAAGWYNSNSFALKRLTGEYVLDHHTASQCDPLYDLRAQEWYQPWYADVMDGLAAPRLAWPSEVVGRVTADAAEVTQLPEGTPVCAGTVDAWAEAFSAGVRRPGDLMLMYGSTMFFVQVLHDITSHPELWTTAGVDPGTYTLAAGMSTSGSLTSWIQDLVGDVPFADLVREAAAVPPGSGGILLLPYFTGERTPIFDPRARGVIAGLTLRHQRGHLFRAVYEGIGFGIRQILQLLDTDRTPVHRLVAVGGGTQGGSGPRSSAMSPAESSKCRNRRSELATVMP